MLYDTSALMKCVALRKESVDRNTQRRDFKALGLPSLSARRAWIEMSFDVFLACMKEVALRKESVDRNSKIAKKVLTSTYVALRKESVDRNNSLESKQIDPSVSLSARRAWIEIFA